MSSALSHLLPRRAIVPGEPGVPPPCDQIDYLKFLAEQDRMTGRARPPSVPIRGNVPRGDKKWK